MFSVTSQGGPHRGLTQNLNGSKISGSLVDQGCLRPTKGMRSTLFRSQSDHRYPLVDQPCVLSST